MQVKMERKRVFLIRRLLVYIIGLLIISSGSNLFVNAALGVAPFSSIAYALTFLLPLSFGMATLIMNILHLILECLLLKQFSISHVMQFIMAILYSSFLQMLKPITDHVVADTFPHQILVAGVACFLMAIGMTLMIVSNFVVLPAEGLVGALAFIFRKDFGKIKTIADISVVIIAFLLAFTLSGKIVIGIGTLMSALLTGSINHCFLSLCKDRLLRFMGE